MTVRRIRVLEYEYPDTRAAAEDMARWSVPAMGATTFGLQVVRSTIILPYDTYDTPTYGGA